MSDFSGKTVVVFGATGNVGWGAARAFVAAGAQVIAPTRSKERSGQLAAALGSGVHTLELDVSSPQGAQTLGNQVRARGGADHVFASLGPWWQKGPTIEQSPDEYRRVLAASLDCHVFAAQALLPDMVQRPGSSYTIVTGAGGHHVVPGTGLLVIAVNGVFGLSKALRAEHRDHAVRINEILIATRVERKARDGVVPAAELGQCACELASSEVRGHVLEFRDPAAFRAALARSAGQQGD